MIKNFLNTGALTTIVVFTYLFLYIPISILVIFSFNNGPFPAPWVGFTLHSYVELFQSSVIWHAFMNSIIVALSATALSLLLSLCLVYYGSITRSSYQLIKLFYGSVFVPEIVLAMGLLSLFSLFSVPLGLISLIVGHTVLGLGYAAPLIYGNYQLIDIKILEASYDLGATRRQSFFTITLPLLRPVLTVAGLLVFILSFDDFLISFFCAGGEAQTLSLYIYSMIRSGISPIVNALSTVLLVLSSLLVIVFSSLALRSKLW
jgi:spermidine/putrescine transport system permease protein